ncbi:hypothetical protein P4H08_18870 [Bacillus cereus]|nr:hypothetical protein [Bacillus cereus]
MNNEMLDQCQDVFAGIIAERIQLEPRCIDILKSFINKTEGQESFSLRSMNKMNISTENDIPKQICGYYVDMMYFCGLLEIDDSISSHYKRSFYVLSTLGYRVLELVMTSHQEN